MPTPVCCTSRGSLVVQKYAWPFLVSACSQDPCPVRRSTRWLHRESVSKNFRLFQVRKLLRKMREAEVLHTLSCHRIQHKQHSTSIYCRGSGCSSSLYNNSSPAHSHAMLVREHIGR